MIENCITGSNGFIGKHLVKKLKGEVKCIRHSAISYCNDSVNRFFFLSTYGNMAHHTNQMEIVRANVKDLLSVLWTSPLWTLYMSSSSVTLDVQTPYSRSKKAGEEILHALPEMKSCIVRPFSVTGVGEQKEHLIPTLIRSCMEGEEMTFDPYPVHDFIDVEDVVDAMIRLAYDRATGTFEFGNGIPYTNNEVKERVEEITGKKANVKLTTHLRPYDSSTWYLQQQPTNWYWQPKKFLSTSITEMVEAYRNGQNN